MTPTPQTRELLTVGVVVALYVLVPLCFIEMFPFSRAPMFADAPRQYCDYRVLGPHGGNLDVKDFGLHRNYWGNPIGVGVGFVPPPTLDDFGTVATEDEVRAWVSGRLTNRPELPFVWVEQDVIGPVDDDRVGVRVSRRWRIDNPAAGGGGE